MGGWICLAICGGAAYSLSDVDSPFWFWFAVANAVLNVWSFGIMHNYRHMPQLAPNSWTSVNILTTVVGVGLLIYALIAF